MPSKNGGRRKRKRKKKEDGCSSYHPWRLSQLSTKESRRRRINPRTKPEDKLLPFPHAFDHSISIWSCSAVVALTKTQFLSPFSLPNLLYRTRCVWAYSLNSKKPLKSGPYTKWVQMVVQNNDNMVREFFFLNFLFRVVSY